ncbi:MAG: pyruvate formate-lyase, partial [Clostridia bacterium]|nr:pyruvate formate-lyase [Clostridia bacterium]
KHGIERECELLLNKADDFATKNWSRDAYASLCFSTCIEQCRFWRPETLQHYNYGFHGAGIANGADALAAVKETIYDKQLITPTDLLKALNADFHGYIEIQRLLKNCTKMGNNEDIPDTIASEISEYFSAKLNKLRTKYGSRIRPGTGSAMEYILSSRDVPATADGRNAGTPYSSSYSPAITTKLNGPLSVISSFTKFDMKKLINGGPLTMEIHDATFRNEQAIEKVAYLVKNFIDRGGHQLQLNSINRDRLLDAQKHPEKHQNLIVRVWGWSGYFNELEIEYQNHIIKRTEFNVT